MIYKYSKKYFKMKNKNLFDTIVWIVLLLFFVLIGIAGCKTKKSTTDLKVEEKENVSVLVTENKAQKTLITENKQKQESKSETDKSFIEAWMEIKSDEATFEDKAGNKWTFKNPQVNQKSSQTNDISKTGQTDNNSNKVATIEENQQSNINATLSKQTKTDLQQSNSSKGKEPIWLWIVGGCVVGGVLYLVLKRFRLVYFKRKEKTIY